MLKRWTGCGLVMMMAASVWAAGPTETSREDEPQEYTVLQQRPDRIIAKLPNRMIVIAQRVPTQPVVSVQTWIKTGSIYEQEHVGAGLSHFLEHLLAGGTTTTRPESESNAILGEIGASTNAATGLDTVRYHINTTADNTDAAIALLTDWMQNSVISQEEFERERGVIQKEFSMGAGDPGRIFWKLTQQARYRAHPARHPTIGYLDEFLSITRDEVYDFYQRMYVPNNMLFVVVGDIDPRAVVEQVASLWADVPTGELPDVSFPVEPEITSPRELSGHADIQRPRLRLAWPGTRLGGEGDYALDLLGSILGQGESSRLVRTVRDELGVVTSISAYNLSFPWGRGFFGIDAELADASADIEAVRAKILEQVERLRDEPVTDAELDRAKRKVMADAALRNQTVEGIAHRLASDTIGMGDPNYLARYADAIQKITPEQLQAAAKRFLTPDRLITVTLLPQEKGTQPQPLERPQDVEGADGFERVEVELDNRRVIAELKHNLAEPASAGDEVVVGPVREFTLDNGLRLRVQRNTTVPGAAMQLYWLGGLLGDAPGREGAASAMAAMMLRGTETRTAQEIARAVEDMGAHLSAESGNNTTFVTATALSQDWREVMALMADVTLNPSFPAQQWKSVQPRLLAAIDRQDDSWAGELRGHFREVYYDDHPWSQTPLGRAEVVKSLTADDLAAYHDAHLAAENAVLAVVGDVDPEKVRDAAARLFGGMDAKPQAAGVFDPPEPEAPEATIEQFDTRKPIAAVQIGFGPGLERSDPDYARVQVLSTLMSDFPAGWLEQQLRGRGPGLVYAVGAGVQTGLVPGYFAILFNTQPSQVVEAVERAMSVVERAKTGPIGEDDLARAKAKVLTREFFGRQGNASRAAELALDELYGIDDPGAEAFIAQVKAMDADAVREVAKKYLRNPVVVVLSSEPVDEAALEAAVGEVAQKEPAQTR